MNNIVMMPIGEVHPYPNNPRINSEAVDKVAASLKSFGWRQPIVVDSNNVIIVGHTRLQAAKRLRMKEVPVLVADDLSDEQVKAYRLADNKTAEFAEWDMDKLGDELAGIFDIDMDEFGFDLSEFIEEPEVVEDDFEPEIPEEPTAKRGDIYKLGRHRLMCGDSTSVDDVDKLVDGVQTDMLLTDVPRDKSSRLFLRDAFANAKLNMKSGGVFHIWHDESESYNVRGALLDAELTCCQQLIWVKSHPKISKADFQRTYESVLTGDNSWNKDAIEKEYEPCLYGWKSGEEHKWFKKRREKDVLFFDEPRASAEYPTMKPILLFNYEMQCNTQKGDAVLDLFSGSGTTLMAAEQNGRTAYCMELDPKYVDVIIKRWESFTGQEAILLNEEGDD